MALLLHAQWDIADKGNRKTDLERTFNQNHREGKGESLQLQTILGRR